MKRNIETLKKSLHEVQSLDDTGVERLLFAAEHGLSICLVGPPSCGKTMIARRIATYWGGPFRAPHHTTSHAGLVGGLAMRTKYSERSRLIRLGEIGQACGGTLFVDDAPEFSHDNLEAIAKAHCGGELHVRLGGESYWVGYPNDFRLIVAMSPCPCGSLNRWAKENEESRTCKCTPAMIRSHDERAYILRSLCEAEIRIDRTLYVPRPTRTGANLDTQA